MAIRFWFFLRFIILTDKVTKYSVYQLPDTDRTVFFSSFATKRNTYHLPSKTIVSTHIYALRGCNKTVTKLAVASGKSTHIYIGVWSCVFYSNEIFITFICVYCTVYIKIVLCVAVFYIHSFIHSHPLFFIHYFFSLVPTDLMLFSYTFFGVGILFSCSFVYSDILYHCK